MKGYRTYRTFILFCGTLLLAVTLPLRAQQDCSQSWTLDADFETGVSINVAIGNDEIALDPFTAPLPFVYVAASARGTAVRIDINTGAILGEYLTSPSGMGRDPSRTTVDKLGNVWVTNRAEFGGGKGSMTRIGVIIGGTRGTKNGDGSFTDDPLGQYLRPPFLYSTVSDRDGDGYIKTSRGLGNILPWTNAAGADINGGVSTADDEAIINYTRVAGTGARTVAVDANNDVWVGGTGDNEHEKISGVTGLPIPGTFFVMPAFCGGYGGLVDGNNVLWSARGRFGDLLRYDANTPVPPAAGSVATCIPPGTRGDYGLGIEPGTGNIWQTSLSGGFVSKLTPAGALIAQYGHGNTYAQGVAVDASGNVWVAHSILGPGTTVGHLRTNGTFVGNVPLPGGAGPSGVAIDANGKIWVTNLYTNNVSRIDPTAGPIGGGGFPLGAVDLTVSLGAGAGPYNYSDMTGFVSLGSSTPSGTWSIIHDGGVAAGEWGELEWNATQPEGTTIAVEVRAADAQLDLADEPWLAVTSGEPFCDDGIDGRYIEIRVTLTRTSGDGIPSVQDLTLSCCNEPPVAVCEDLELAADENCLANPGPYDIGGESYDPDGEGDIQVTLAMSPEGPFGLGDHLVTLTVTDADGATDECTATVSVIDATAPVITLSSTVISPWPPNHNYTTVTIADIIAAVADNCDATLEISDATITSVSSDEVEDAAGNGDGSTLEDIVIAGDCQSVDVRAERSGSGNGRVYRINCAITDASGNTGTATYLVPVRKNEGAGGEAVADDPAYTVNGSCGGGAKPAMPGVRIVEGYSLEQNIPNPFNATTEIPFAIAAPGHVSIGVFDEVGARVATLVDSERPAGAQSVTFDASALPSGSYFYVLEAAGVKLARRLTLSK